MLLKSQTSLQIVLSLAGLALAVACSAGSGPDDGADGSTDSPTGSGGGGISLDGSASGGFTNQIPDEVIDAPPTASCADGILDDDEACDDGNMVSLDGCGSNCRYTEPGWVCPDPGEPCRAFAKCGDSTVVFPEQCDDGNFDAADGCSANCKFELGWTCDGSPSVCRQTECGDGAQEGSETCEAADGQPFDGCSVICQAEPSCTDNGCTSSCGDGLIIGDEQCDDGNGIDDDGCSSTCQQEPGYICSQAPPCEGDACTLQLPIIFRDFNESHPDFWPPYKEGDMDGFAPGIVTDRLDANGKPVYLASPALSHVTSPESFNQWYNNVDGTNAMVVGDIMLYANGQGGYVNRYGENGEQFITYVKTPAEQGLGNTTCEAGCLERARNGSAPLTGGALRCGPTEDTCNGAREAVNQAGRTLDQLEEALRQAEEQQTPDPDAIAALEEDILAAEAALEAAQLASEECTAECEAALEERMTTCLDMCNPCSFDVTQNCLGGEELALDGNPLFFPIDDTPGILQDTRGPAKIPAQVYMGLGWPWEPPADVSDAGVVGPNQPLHNFHFTSEIAYWFKYTDGMAAEFSFIGDDDVFVYVNRRLLIDLGGIHVPLTGQFTFAANGGVTWSTSQPLDPGDEGDPGGPLANGTTSVAELGLVDGGVYEIKVFHAERKPEGSSFQLTLSGFNTARSECLPICGDGIIAAGEQCDDGDAENTGGHNRCNADCTIGEYCGDGVKQDEEECDDADPNAPPGCAGCRDIIVK